MINMFFARLYKVTSWVIIALIGTATSSFAKDPVVLVFIIDGIQRDAVEVAAAHGAENLKFLMDNGVKVKDAYSTSPAPRMYLPDGSLPWGTSSSPNVAMHTGTHVFESRQMDDIFLSARRGKIKSVFAGGASNYEEFTTPDFTYAGSLTDSAVVQYGINHFKKDGTRLIRLHLQQIRNSWTGPEDKLDPNSKYQQALLKVDRLLGKFIQVLKDANVWDSTYVIVSGDHGMGITRNSEHPPSVFSSWSTYMNFYGPGIKRGHLDPKVSIEPKGTTATFLSNIFEGQPEEINHPKIILRYLESKNRQPGDEFSDFRLGMLNLIKELVPKK